MSIFTSTQNRRGMALLNMVFIFIFIGVLVVAGMKMYGSIVSRAKIKDSKSGLENQVKVIAAWGVKNGRLPTTTGSPSEYVGIFGTHPLDSWGRPITYIYDGNLSTTATGGLCGRTTTSLSFMTTSNVAFILLSGGENSSLQSTLAMAGTGTGYLNGGSLSPIATGAITVTGGNGSVTLNPPVAPINNSNDIIRYVTLYELQAMAGCFGSTMGYLRIVNNELPSSCITSTSYSATILANGGVPGWSWTVTNAPSWLLCNNNICSSGPFSGQTLNLTSAPAPNNYPISPVANLTFTLTDSTGNSVTRVLPINRSSDASCATACTGTPGCPDACAANNACKTACSASADCASKCPACVGGGAPTGGAVTYGADSGINTSNASDANALSQNIVSGMSGIQVVGNLIEFGFNQGNGSACIWYPYNFPLFGKTLRAYWNFCFANSDTSSDSTTYADGYTFTLMQGSNPTTYCGTGTPSDPVTNPFFDCQYSGHFGEFLAYCGLPGQSTALEFDIYPNSGSQTRNDPSNDYNHIAIVNAINEHNGPTLSGLYGENTHNYGGNPACGTTLKACNGTCTGNKACSGTCDGVAVTNKTCAGTCFGTCNGTCNGTGSGCIYNGFPNINFTVPSGHTAATWLEDGCNTNKDNHNARVEVHSRCNSDCSQCETSSCTTKSFIKVWIDKNNNNLVSNESSTPDLSYCADLPTALNQFKAGFTQATGAKNQLGYISNFILKSYGNCSVPVISPATLPAGALGIPYAAQVSATGGQAPYTWSLSSSNIPGVAASTLPPGLSTTLLTSGTCPGTTTPTCTNSSPCICGTPTTEGTYNTVLVSATDSCSADTCANTASRSYTISTTPTFATFILNSNVFVYGTQFVFSGGNVSGANATTVIKGDLNTSDLNGGATVSVTTIYIDGHVYLDGGSAGLGSSTNPGNIYVNGDTTLWGGTRDIYGDVHVNGNFSLKDAHIHGDVYVNGNVTLGWTPTLDSNSHIYYTGNISYPNNYSNSILSKCVHVSSVPSFSMPNYSIPPLKADSWYTSQGYVTGNPALVDNIKVLSNNYSSTSWVSNRSNVTIVSKGDITITGMGGSALSGVLFAPYGKVTFDGGSFTGVVIARDGFFVTSGGTTVTFQNISNYISDPNNYPF